MSRGTGNDTSYGKPLSCIRVAETCCRDVPTTVFSIWQWDKETLNRLLSIILGCEICIQADLSGCDPELLCSELGGGGYDIVTENIHFGASRWNTSFAPLKPHLCVDAKTTKHLRGSSETHIDTKKPSKWKWSPVDLIQFPEWAWTNETLHRQN